MYPVANKQILYVCTSLINRQFCEIQQIELIRSNDEKERKADSNWIHMFYIARSRPSLFLFLDFPANLV